MGMEYILSYCWMVMYGDPPSSPSCYHEVYIGQSPFREYNDIIKGSEPRSWDLHEYTFSALSPQHDVNIIVYCEETVTETFQVFVDDVKLRPAGTLCSGDEDLSSTASVDPFTLLPRR
ncbi:hypothetical protein NM208_g7780 [Fusarium decemcellulare]|nr:hypothetical protein NM208_g7780 [Fusarium decemcellulare]